MGNTFLCTCLYPTRNVGVILLALLLFSSCTTFNPRPYQESLEEVKSVNKQTKIYQASWHDYLIMNLEVLNNQLIKSLKGKLLQEVFDKLNKDRRAGIVYDPIPLESQDIFFPIQGSRVNARMIYAKDIQEIIRHYSVVVTSSGTTVTKDLMALYIEGQKTNKALWYSNLSPAELEFIENGIAKLRKRIADIPFLEVQQREFDRLIVVVEAHKKFSTQLTSQHDEFEQELISALQSAASALKSNLWLAKIGNKTIGKLNTLVENALPLSQGVKEDSDESSQAE